MPASGHTTGEGSKSQIRKLQFRQKTGTAVAAATEEGKERGPAAAVVRVGNPDAVGKSIGSGHWEAVAAGMACAGSAGGEDGDRQQAQCP